jgi:uncharacterized membrane protein
VATVIQTHSLLDRTFFVSLILKGLDGILELVGGVLLLLIRPEKIDSITRLLTQREIDQDPHDFIDTHLRELTAHLDVGATAFAAVYLLLHGAIKLVLVWAVLKGHVRAYPWMIAFLVAFILYQGYEMIGHFSIGLALLTAFDMFIVYLTWREYGIKRRQPERSISLRPEASSAPPGEET